MHRGVVACAPLESLRKLAAVKSDVSLIPAKVGSLSLGVSAGKSLHVGAALDFGFRHLGSVHSVQNFFP